MESNIHLEISFIIYVSFCRQLLPTTQADQRELNTYSFDGYHMTVRIRLEEILDIENILETNQSSLISLNLFEMSKKWFAVVTTCTLSYSNLIKVASKSKPKTNTKMYNKIIKILVLLFGCDITQICIDSM